MSRNAFLTYFSFLVCIPHFSLAERKVTDLGQVQSPYGVPLDFSYNETSSYYNKLSSAPGCPQSIDGYPWVYFGSPPRCYLAGLRGPCGDGRILMLERNSIQVGVCACECFKHRPLHEPLPQSDDRRYTFCLPYSAKEQVYDRERQVCYNLQEQGPCEHSEWLVQDMSGTSLICVRSCPRDSLYNYRIAQCEVRYRQYEGTFYGGHFVGGANCPQEQIYSQTLRTCVPSNHDFLFLN